MANSTNMAEERNEEFVFSKKDLEELEHARSMPITFDDDCPEMTPERAVRFKRVNPVRRKVAN